MSVIIVQEPKYRTIPVGQDIVFSVSDNVIVATKYNVKFTAKIYLSNEVSSVYTNTSLIATLEVSPNNKGVGIFSLNPILESYVSPQYEGTNFDNVIFSTFKSLAYSEKHPFPIHVIDKYTCNKKNARYFGVEFNTTWYDSADLISQQTTAKGLLIPTFFIFNGVIDYDAPLQITDNNFGYNLNEPKLIMNDYYSQLGKFLSNAPIEQYARLTDYGTFSFLNFLNLSDYGFQVGSDTSVKNMISYIDIKLYNSSGTQLGSTIQVSSGVSTGGFNNNNDFANTRVMYFGVFPANLDGASYSVWNTNKANVSYYTVQAFDDVNVTISQLYKINIIENACKGFESIRLTWLNQWGTWDYYTFNKKSIKTIETDRTNYTQLRGTWNDSAYRLRGFKGGKKNFRVNSKQLITVNTNFISESEAVWFEDLINSTDVYVLNSYSTTDSRTGILNKYVEPVTVTTSNYVRKTKANDKLIQYTFNLEKANNKRTQLV